MEEREIKIITLGDTGVGKTSIIKRIKDGIFDETIKCTLNCDIFFLKKPYNSKNLTIKLTFYDTIGQEKYQKCLPLQYIRDSHIVLLVFSNADTLNNLKRRWYEFYKQNANIENSRFILIGNKTDKFGNERENIIKLGEEFSEEIDAHFLTCSAKNAENIDNLERYIITEAKRFIDTEEMENSSIAAAPSITSTINNRNKFHLNKDRNKPSFSFLKKIKDLC